MFNIEYIATGVRLEAEASVAKNLQETRNVCLENENENTVNSTEQVKLKQFDLNEDIYFSIQ